MVSISTCNSKKIPLVFPNKLKHCYTDWSQTIKVRNGDVGFWRGVVFFFFFWGRKILQIEMYSLSISFVFASIAVHTWVASGGRGWLQRKQDGASYREQRTHGEHTHGKALVNCHVQWKKRRNGKIRPDLGGRGTPSSPRGNSLMRARLLEKSRRKRDPWLLMAMRHCSGRRGNATWFYISQRRSYADGRCLFSSA